MREEKGEKNIVTYGNCIHHSAPLLKAINDEDLGFVYICGCCYVTCLILM